MRCDMTLTATGPTRPTPPGTMAGNKSARRPGQTPDTTHPTLQAKLAIQTRSHSHGAAATNTQPNPSKPCARRSVRLLPGAQNPTCTHATLATGKAQTNRNWLMSAEGAATWADVALVKAFFLSPNCDAQNASERVNDGGCE